MRRNSGVTFMSVMASQITDNSIVCSVACLAEQQKKHQSPRYMSFVRETTGNQ